MQQLPVSEAVRLLRARSRDISELFFPRRLRDDPYPVVIASRLVPEDSREAITARLRPADRPREGRVTDRNPAFRADAAVTA